MATQTAAEASALTEQHRQAQSALRSRTLRSFLLLWPLWHGDEQSFGRLVVATMPLVRSYHRVSAALAGSYYQTVRGIEGVPGRATVRLAAAVDEQQVVKSMYVTGQVMTRNALRAGQSPAEARVTALSRVSGAVARHVLAGGRETILDSVAADQRAHGWARVTDGAPCYFCLTLASRGAVYKTEQTAGFEAHDHCGCTAMPVFDGTTIPNLDRWREIYDQAQQDGEASGLLQPGENPSAARLNAVRRYLAAH